MTKENGVAWYVRVLRDVYEPFEIPGADGTMVTVQRLALGPSVLQTDAERAQRLLAAGDAVEASEREYRDFMAPLVDHLRTLRDEVIEKLEAGDVEWLRGNRDTIAFFLSQGNFGSDAAVALARILSVPEA